MSARKAFGLLALASLAGASECLGAWAGDLREEFLKPILLSPDFQNDPDKVLWMYLDLILTLAGIVSSAPLPSDNNTSVALDEVEYMSSLCYRFFDHGWQYFHPFEWLSLYLRRRYGTKLISARELKSAAKASFERGKPFQIRDFP